MSFFSKKKNEELFFLLDEGDNEFTLGQGSTLHPEHALTPDEVLNFSSNSEEGEAFRTGALDSLKRRMLENTANTEAKQEPTGEKSAPAENEDFDLSAFSESFNKVKSQKQWEADLNHPEAEKAPEPKEPATEQEPSLLEKCRPFILDGEEGESAMESAPTYRLESVAEILNSESKKAIDKLSQKYEIAFDDLGKYKKPDAEAEPEASKPAEEPKESKVPEEAFDDLVSSLSRVSQVQTNVLIISDIDPSAPQKEPETPDIHNTATIKFTPVSGIDNTSRISVSSQTKPIDLTGELTGLPEAGAEEPENEVQLEQSEFEEYIPKDEFHDEKDAKRLLRRLSVKKRSAFLRTVFSGLGLILLCIAKLPFMSEMLLAHTMAANIICTAILGIITLINADMFKSIPKILSRHSTPDVLSVTASVSVIAYGIAAVFKNEIGLDLILLGASILFVRALSSFWNASYMLTGFKQISASSPKRAVKLIGDQAVTFAMAKNAIEGDVLAAAPQRTKHIDSYMKYSTFRIVLSGKLPVITVISLLLSVVVGLACTAYFDGVLYGFYSAAAIQCFAALPVIFMIDNLPLYSSANRLSRMGAMIAGKTGAERIENANAAVFSADELFPSGTVQMHRLQVLSDNSIDDTIIRAASLTEAMRSPLAPIFKKIAGTGGNTVLPDSDTVKYEDRMGISGWVDDKLLFIGNRTLMEAHGIEVPNVELDRKILRQGLFPVYVASEAKACALITVRYTARGDIAKELRRVSSLGVTMLINSSDPNMTEEMICDYFGLYSDSVKVMSAAGCHMYKNAVTPTSSYPAPAAYKSNPIGLAAIISNASRIKKSNLLLTVLYAISAVLGTVLFAYISFDGSGSLMGGATVLLYSLISAVISYILYLTQKP